MEFSRRWTVIFVLVVVLSVALVNLFGVGVTGNAVGFSSPVSCENLNLVGTWEDIFVESSDDVVFFVNDSLVGGECAGFLGYKVVGNETWVIGSEVEGRSFGRFNGLYIAGYFNTTPEWVSVVEGIDEYSEDNLQLLFEVLDDQENLQNRSSPLDVDGAAAEFSDIFLIENGTWEEMGDYFRFMAGGGDQNYSFVDQALVVTERDGLYYYYQFENNSNYSPPAEPILNSNITDYTFERNSSWNLAFSVDEYFSYPVNATFEVYLGYNNSNGQWINYTIDGDEVSFRPAEGFLGTRDFRVSVRNPLYQSAVSNSFNVTIVEDINEKPKKIKNFGIISLDRVSVLTFDLRRYFRDDDGDNLTYRATGDDGVLVNFSGHSMSVKLGSNFSDSGEFRVYASDGVLEVSSGSIDVIALDINTTFIPVNNTPTATINGSNSSPGNGTAGAGQAGEGGSYFWLWVVFGVAFVLALIGVGIYFFVFKTNRVISSPAQTTTAANGVNPVTDYLKNLNLKKK